MEPNTHMFSLYLTFSLAIAATTVAVIVRVPGRCPTVCRPDIHDTFNECRRLTALDCTMAYCGGPASRTTVCRLRSTGPRRVFPGETAVVSALNLSAPSSATVTLPLVFGAAASRLDVYLLVDATASMGGIILSLQDDFGDIVRMLDGSADAAFGVGIFRDERELDHGFQALQAMTKNMSEVSAALGQLEASGGFDAPEANLVALHRVATGGAEIGWRPGARHIVVLVADNPGHEPSCREGKVWLTRYKVAKALNDAEVSVIAVSYPRGSLNEKTTTFECDADVSPAGGGQGRFIAERTGGKYLAGTDSMFNARLVTDAIGQLSARVALTANSCGAHADLTMEPELPAIVGDMDKVAVTLRPRRSLCGVRWSFKCELAFNKSGSGVAPFKVSLAKPVDC